MVPPRLKVEILVSWLWVKRCVFAGIKKLGWYSVGRGRVSLVLNRFSRSLMLFPGYMLASAAPACANTSPLPLVP